MATNTLKTPIKQEKLPPSITYLQEVAETIQIDALQYAQSRFTQPIHAADLEEVLQRHDFISYFKLGLAKHIANTLAAHDENVQAIYYFDPNLNSDAIAETYMPLDASVNLLVRVKSKSAALKSFAEALDKALTQQSRKLPSPLFASLASILNAILITEEDVNNSCGYAVLLSSMYFKPRQVW